MPSIVYKAGDILLCDFDAVDGEKAVGIVYNDLTNMEKNKEKLSILWLTPTSEDRDTCKHFIIYAQGIKHTTVPLESEKKIRVIGNLDGAELEKTILSSL